MARRWITARRCRQKVASASQCSHAAAVARSVPDVDRALADEHRLAADTDRGDRAVGLVRLHVEAARAPHLDPLLDFQLE